MESPVPPFDGVREQLLRAGIPPRHAARYVAELGDHLDDLVAQQRAANLDAGQAEQRARELLGSDEQLAAVMIESAPRSLAARAPGVVFALLPMLLMVVGTISTGLAAFKLMWPVRGVALTEMPAAYGYFIAAAGYFTSYVLGAAVAAGCIVLAVRQRMRSAWVWTGLALTALLSGPIGFHTRFVPADAGAGTGARFGMIRVAYQQGEPDLAATMTLALSRSAVMFLVLALAYLLLQKYIGRRSMVSRSQHRGCVEG
jgi:hypothetical protein